MIGISPCSCDVFAPLLNKLVYVLDSLMAGHYIKFVDDGILEPTKKLLRDSLMLKPLNSESTVWVKALVCSCARRLSLQCLSSPRSTNGYLTNFLEIHVSRISTPSSAWEYMYNPIPRHTTLQKLRKPLVCCGCYKFD